mmetsp:Transcript_23286/g.47392  ORF Transcript_23286/g.47392 Transcript_23286/m.47392 type:complete len:182 (+) Transcript_23286:83-628(+)
MAEVSSDGKLSSSVLELAQTLTRYNQELTERTAEKERMSKILAEFRKHTAWQGQRKQLMRRNQERLFNESFWLETKTAEVRQDLLLVSNELRQVKAELGKCKATATKAELDLLEREVKLEQDACSTVQQICTQANKAIAAHAHERDRYRAEADAYTQQALKLKDRIEELAYQVNGLAAGAL